MRILAFSLGAFLLSCGAAMVFSHRDRMPFSTRLISFLLGVPPGAVGAYLALTGGAAAVAEAFFIDALAAVAVTVAARLVAREHRRDADTQTASVKGRAA